MLQFVDAWTNNFAYVGRRATGTVAGSFLLVPPGWQGTAPDAVRLIELTNVATIVGRWACDHGYEAAYPATYTDANGDQLDGHNRYTLTFDHDPPVDAFWSITMYDLPDPAAPFRPLMSLYQPQAAILNGTYQIPPITKAAS